MDKPLDEREKPSIQPISDAESGFDASAIDDLFEEVARSAAPADGDSGGPLDPDAPAAEPLLSAPQDPLPAAEPPAPGPEPAGLVIDDREEAAPAEPGSELSGAIEASAAGAEGDSEGSADAEAPEPVSPEEARAVLEQLEQLEGELRALEGDEKARAPLLGGAAALLERASDVLESFPKDDPTFEILRDELLDAYFALDRQVRPGDDKAPRPYAATPRRPRPAPKKGKKKTKVTQAVRRRATATEEVETRRQRLRTTILVVLALGLLVARVGHYFLVEQATPTGAPKMTQQTVGGAQVTRVSEANSLREDAKEGVPIVSFLVFRRGQDGSLRARAVAVDLDSAQLKLSFKWFKNDKLLKVEHDGYIAPDEVEAFARYRVEVTAGDGKLTSRPLKSRVIFVDPSKKGNKPAKGGKKK